MGMFDSLYEGDRETYEVEWQTKAYDCNLDCYWVGDKVPEAWPGLASYQVQVLGGTPRWSTDPGRHSLATVLDGVLVNIDNERARSLPLINYSGHLITDCDAAGVDS